MEAHNRLYTMIKLDEVTNLGAARIRLRSLLAVLSRRPVPKFEPLVLPDRPHFTPECKATHTILAPQMAPIHFELIKHVLTRYGYNLVIPETNKNDAINAGLQYVHNDMCYPAIVVIGQMLAALKSGKYDPDHTSIVLFERRLPEGAGLRLLRPGERWIYPQSGRLHRSGQGHRLRRPAAECDEPHAPLRADSRLDGPPVQQVDRPLRRRARPRQLFQV